MSDQEYDKLIRDRAASYGSSPSTKRHRLARAHLIESTAMRSLEDSGCFRSPSTIFQEDMPRLKSDIKASLKSASQHRFQAKIAEDMLHVYSDAVKSHSGTIPSLDRSRVRHNRLCRDLSPLDTVFGHSDDLKAGTPNAIDANDTLLPIVHGMQNDARRTACHERAGALSRFQSTILPQITKQDREDWHPRMKALSGWLQDELWYTVFPNDAQDEIKVSELLATCQTRTSEALSELITAMDQFDEAATARGLLNALPTKPAIADLPLWGRRDPSDSQ